VLAYSPAIGIKSSWGKKEVEKIGSLTTMTFMLFPSCKSKKFHGYNTITLNTTQEYYIDKKNKKTKKKPTRLSTFAILR